MGAGLAFDLRETFGLPASLLKYGLDVDYMVRGCFSYFAVYSRRRAGLDRRCGWHGGRVKQGERDLK